MFNRYSKIIVSLLLAAAILAVYWQLKNCDFISLDDSLYVTDNKDVFLGITLKGIVWSVTAHHADNWHPVTWLSHMADCQLYGLNPVGHHFTNLILHLANTLLLFLLFTRVTKALWPSAMVAALFALHPLHVESVAWVAERKDVLSTFFWMTTIWAYIWYAEGPGLTRYLAVLFSFALGLMAKPMLVTLPFVLLLLDFWPLGRFRPALRPGEGHPEADLALGTPKTLAYLVVEKVPLLVLAGFSSIITIMAQRQALISLERIPFGLRIGNTLVSYVNYLGKMLWPAHLAVFYPHPGPDLSWWGVAASGLVLVGCSTLALLWARKHPYLPVGWFWYLGTLVPVIGLVQVGTQSMADRYTYIPLIGLFIMVVWGARDLTARWHRPKALLAVVAGSVLASLAVLTWHQVGYWRNSISLFEHALEVTNNNWLVYTSLGSAYDKQGKTAKAISLYQKSITINPNYAESYNNLGVAYANQGKFDEAIPLYQKAASINPNYADPNNNLGLVYMNQGKFDEAISLFERAITLKQNYAEPYHNLGLAYANQGKFEEAMPLFRQAITNQPNMAEAYSNIGLVYANQGNFEDAIPLFQQAIRIRPTLTAPYNNLGLVYAKQGKTDEAISILQKALLIDSNNTLAQEMLNKLNEIKTGTN